MTTYKLPEPVGYKLITVNYGLDAEQWETLELRSIKWDDDCSELFDEDQMQAAYSQGRIDQRTEQEELERLYDSVRVAMNNERKAR